MDKKRIAARAASIASGVEPLRLAFRDVKSTAGRLRSVAAEAFAGRGDRVPAHERNGYKYVIWSPFAGRYTDENGEVVAVIDRSTMPDFDKLPGAARGALFGGDDFRQLMSEVFTEEQRAQMARGANATRLCFVVAIVAAVVCFAGLLAVGSVLPALACIAPGILFAAQALRNDVYVARVQDGELYDLAGYFKARGRTFFMRVAG